jgi:hypothetical protein
MSASGGKADSAILPACYTGPPMTLGNMRSLGVARVAGRSAEIRQRLAPESLESVFGLSRPEKFGIRHRIEIGRRAFR